MNLLVYYYKYLFLVVILVLDVVHVSSSSSFSSLVTATGAQEERVTATTAEAEEEVRFTNRQQRRMNHPHHIVGGYAPITDLHTNTRVQEIAQYILETLISSAVTDNENTYSFQSQFIDPKEKQEPPSQLSSETTSPIWNAMIVSGNQQVVAGMNYHLTIVITKTIPSIISSTRENETLEEPSVKTVGAFEVVVYDQFGTLSITRWGTEISIHDADALLSSYNSNNKNEEGDDEETTDVNTILDSEGKL